MSNVCFIASVGQWECLWLAGSNAHIVQLTFNISNIRLWCNLLHWRHIGQRTIGHLTNKTSKMNYFNILLNLFGDYENLDEWDTAHRCALNGFKTQQQVKIHPWVRACITHESINWWSHFCCFSHVEVVPVSSPVSKWRLSLWVVNTIVESYSGLNISIQTPVVVHCTRGMATSLAVTRFPSQSSVQLQHGMFSTLYRIKAESLRFGTAGFSPVLSC